MNNKNTPAKTYHFITKYLVLLAIPMLLAVGTLYVFSQLIHRITMEQKISALNHTLAVSEQEMINQVKQMLDIEITANNTIPINSSPEQRELVRKLWAEKVRLPNIVDLIFMSGPKGILFSSSDERDAKQAIRNIQNHGRTPEEERVYQQALTSSLPNIWTSSYRDDITGSYTMTLFRRMDNAGNLLGVDINLRTWSQILGNMLYGNNAIRHMVINRSTGQVLVHTDITRISREVQGSWRSSLVGQAGSFYSPDEDEFVAYETMPGEPEWLAITIQSKRDVVSQQILTVTLLLLFLSSGLFIIAAIFFRMRLEGLISSMTQMIRLLRFSPEKELKGVVLPDFPEMKALQSELDLVSERMLQTYNRSRQDGLTGLYNRRYLDETLERLHKLGTPYVLALIDLDHFKSINDRHGHAVGDKVLKRVSAMGLELFGNSAILCRYGGEELAVVFEQRKMDDTLWQVERWRLSVSELVWQEEELRVTFSGGIAPDGGRTVEELITVVDQALYRAKEDGRNRLYRAG